MIHLCYLAAGCSRRFGENKLLVPFAGVPLWRHGYAALVQARDAFGAKLHVISRFPEILDAVGDEGVFSPDSEKGKSYSVRAALDAAGPVLPQDKILFLTADQPKISANTVLRLLSLPLAQTQGDSLPLIACVSDGITDGNPVVFSASLVDALRQLEGDAGGKSLFVRFPDRVARITASPDEQKDIDTKEDMTSL